MSGPLLFTDQELDTISEALRQQIARYSIPEVLLDAAHAPLREAKDKVDLELMQRMIERGDLVVEPAFQAWLDARRAR